MLTMPTRRRNRPRGVVAQAFGQQLRILRKERGWTQGELAAKLAIHHTIIGYYERGIHYPPLPMLQKLAAALDVTLDVLAGNGRLMPDSFQDRELLQFFLRADKLDHKTRSTIKDIIESVLVRAEMDHHRGRRNKAA